MNKLYPYALMVMLCAPQTNARNQQSSPEDEQAWITVFVHGIMSIKSHVTFGNFVKFIQDKMQDSVYSTTVDLMRRDPFFYKNQAMQEYGLRKIETQEDNRGNASYAMAHLFNKMYTYVDGPPVKNYYYTYGWSGLLSRSSRCDDAREFLVSLSQEVDYFKSQGINPKVRVIGYSHGGNICINLASARRNHFPNISLSIDQLILVGTPIQKENDFLINDPLFKRVYNFYSANDMIQRLDFFTSERFFSDRFFQSRKGFDLPEKLHQIQLRVLRPSICGLEPDAFQAGKNFDNECINTMQSHLLRNASPGHIELWFFGWTPEHYRKQYSLSPIPTIGFAPLILDKLKKHKSSLKSINPIVVDIRPYYETMIIKQRQRHAKIMHLEPLLAAHQIEEIKESLEQFKPESYSHEDYTAHLDMAYQEALRMAEQKDCARVVHKGNLFGRKKRRLVMGTLPPR